MILALNLDKNAEKPKEYADKPIIEPFFFTSEEEFLGTAVKDSNKDLKSTEMTKLNWVNRLHYS